MDIGMTPKALVSFGAALATISSVQASILATGSEIDSFGGILYQDRSAPNGALSGASGTTFPDFGLNPGTVSVSAFTNDGVSMGATAGAGEGWVVNAIFAFTVDTSARIRLRGTLFNHDAGRTDWWLGAVELYSYGIDGSLFFREGDGVSFDITLTLDAGMYEVTYLSDGITSVSGHDMFSLTVLPAGAVPLPGAAGLAGLAFAGLSGRSRRRR